MALFLAAAGMVDFLPAINVPPFLYEARGELAFLLLVEGGFLLAQGTLVDIATRLSKRPPIWLVALILIGVIAVSDHTWSVISLARQRGSLVLIPLLFSIAERGTVLWRMPNRPLIEKIAARALIANRIATGLWLFGLVTLAMIVGTVWPTIYDYSQWNSSILLFAGAIYFGVAAYDDWRVRGAKFAAKPRVLFGWDVMGVKELQPL